MSQLEAPKQRDALATLRIERSGEPRRRSIWRTLGRFLLVLMILATLLAAALAVAHRQGWLSIGQLITPRPEVQVALVRVETGRAADALVVATGYLESRRQAMIGAKAPGRIEVLNVEEGTRVKKGEILAVLEHADLDAAVAAAVATQERTAAELQEHEIQIKQYERDFKRAAKARATGAVSEAEHDEERSQHEMAIARRRILRAAVDLFKARAEEARQLRENMYVRAPFDGTVISKDAEVGESILPGGMGEASGRGSVVTIADLDHLEVDTDVKEDYISRTGVGQPAEVAVEAVPDKRYEGRVRTVIPIRARPAHAVKVWSTTKEARYFRTPSTRGSDCRAEK